MMPRAPACPRDEQELSLHFLADTMERGWGLRGTSLVSRLPQDLCEDGMLFLLRDLHRPRTPREAVVAGRYLEGVS